VRCFAFLILEMKGERWRVFRDRREGGDETWACGWDACSFYLPVGMSTTAKYGHMISKSFETKLFLSVILNAPPSPTDLAKSQHHTDPAGQIRKSRARNVAPSISATPINRTNIPGAGMFSISTPGGRTSFTPPANRRRSASSP
jgi:hypothetical protein